MTTKILHLPLVQVAVTTGTNEDWIDGFAFYYDEELTSPIELDGIEFEMEVRHAAPEHIVVLRGGTTDGSLVAAENTLRMNFKEDVMNKIYPLDYVFDIIMRADEHQRVLALGTLLVTLGITR